MVSARCALGVPPRGETLLRREAPIFVVPRPTTLGRRLARLDEQTMADISPVSAAALSGPSLITRSPATSPVAATSVGLGSGLGGSLGLFGGSSVIVDLSVVGQLLSTASTFQANLAALQPGAANSSLGQNFGTDFASLSAEVQNLVDNFNHLQDDLGNLSAAGGGGTSLSLAVSLASSLDQQASAGFANGNSSLTSLADLGISFEPAGPGFVGGSLSVDLQVLQEAFASDPEGSFALLTEAAGSFADLAAGFVAQGVDLSSTLGNLVELAVTTQALGLFGGLAGSSGGLSGLPGLLLLDSLSRGGSNATTNFAALSQFMLVSSLLE